MLDSAIPPRDLMAPRPMGAVTRIDRFPRSPIDFRMHVVTARVADEYESEIGESLSRCVASGVSEDLDRATGAAIGEAWERIAFVEAGRRISAMHSLSPSKQFRSEDYFSLPFLLDRSVDRSQWASLCPDAEQRVALYREAKGGGHWEEVVLPVAVRASSETSTLFDTTNGFACADNFETAVDRAVREVVERDALMLVWLTGARGRVIAADSLLGEAYCQQIRRMEDLGVSTVLRDISTELGMYVFLVAVKGVFRSGELGIAFGAGAHRHPASAAGHAFREACLGWRGVSWRAMIGAAGHSSPEAPDDFAAHAAYYAGWDRFEDVRFLVEPAGAAQRFDHIPGMPDAPDTGHVEAVCQAGRRVYARDLTTPEIASQRLVVVQAVVPGLVPLYIGNRGADAVAAARLPTRVAGAIVECPERLNPAFHPWP